MCPNNKVILVNEENGEYETRDEAVPFGADDEGVDDYADASLIIVVSPHTLSVQPMLILSTTTCFKPMHWLVPIKLAR
jgi:hypothetical protein